MKGAKGELSVPSEGAVDGLRRGFNEPCRRPDFLCAEPRMGPSRRLLPSSLPLGLATMADASRDEIKTPRTPKSPRGDQARLDLQVGRPGGSKRYVQARSLQKRGVASPLASFRHCFLTSICLLLHLFVLSSGTFALLHPRQSN